MSLTPDKLTQEAFRARGYHVVKVEGWGIYPELHRTDFLGIFDYLAFNDTDDDMFAIQTTTKSNASARRKKMLSKKAFAWWTSRKIRHAILQGWYKKNGKWVVQEEELTLADWEKWQAETAEKNSHIDTTTPLYKSLFPHGHELAAECVPSDEEAG